MSLPPSEIPQGAIRFNTDSQKLEFYAQGEWWNMVTEETHTGTPRGTFFGGEPGGSVIDYVEISTEGNAVDFGDLLDSADWCTADAASSTRGYRSGGGNPVTDRIDTWSFSTTGITLDFGNLIDSRLAHGGFSNSTRGIVGGGNPTNTPTKNATTEYWTLQTQGTVTSFGATLNAATSGLVGTANKTRGIFAGGYNPTAVQVMEYVTIASTGIIADFGSLTRPAQEPAGACANSVRGLVAGGTAPSSNAIDFITMASLGDAQDFGDLGAACNSCMGGTNSPVRAIFGGVGGPGANNVIEYVSIMSKGNAINFGDLTVAKHLGSSCSNVHGGL
jgi:hypothetical protein